MNWLTKIFWFVVNLLTQKQRDDLKTETSEKKDHSPVLPTPAEPVAKTEPSWMTLARKEMGIKEVPGSGDNQRVIEYHSVTTLKATEDSVPWCSSFACWVIEAAGIKSPRSARAKDWAKWGKGLNKPQPGCVVVFTRDGGGHVAFFVREDGENLVVLGGNQGDKVCEAKYSKAHVIAYRWPM